MAETPLPSVLDFHSPRRPPSEAQRQLSAWQQNICSQVQDSWGSLLARKVKVQPGKVEPVQYHAGLQALPEDGLGIYLSLGEALLPSMIVFSARQARAFIADMLDLPGGKWPPPSKLTAAEDSMLEVLFQLLAEAIGDGWPADRPLSCQLLETTAKPQRTRLFPIGSAFFSVEFQLDSRFGVESCTWLLLKEETERLILNDLEGSAGDSGGAHPDLAAITERIPMDLVIELGRAELTMSQAAHLAVGDVLVLDQFVSRPLSASLEGQVKWLGLPKRIGSRQAFEIIQDLEPGALPSLTPLQSKGA